MVWSASLGYEMMNFARGVGDVEFRCMVKILRACESLA